jgi:hypothetical protein
MKPRHAAQHSITLDLEDQEAKAVARPHRQPHQAQKNKIVDDEFEMMASAILQGMI